MLTLQQLNLKARTTSPRRMDVAYVRDGKIISTVGSSGEAVSFRYI